MRLRPLWLSIIFLALAGCGNEEPLPVEPQLLLDRETLEFGQEFDRATYVGTEPVETLRLENAGQQPLEITEVSRTGSSVFLLTVPEPLQQGEPVRLESGQYTFVQVTFKPTRAQKYEGQLLIKSNAANTPEKQVGLSGLAITP